MANIDIKNTIKYVAMSSCLLSISHLEGAVDLNLRYCGAASSGDLAVVRSALAQGIDVNVIGRNGRTALHWATAKQNVLVFIFIEGRC
jgi:ankyrin repeat protein